MISIAFFSWTEGDVLAINIMQLILQLNVDIFQVLSADHHTTIFMETFTL